MAKQDEEKALGVTVPKPVEILGIEDSLASLHDAAERRDVLRLMAQKALDEAERIQRQIDEVVRENRRGLAAIAAEIEAR